VTSFLIPTVLFVRRAAVLISTRWKQLDGLMNNAGATFQKRELTAQGIEKTLGVDVVGPAVLTLGLLGPLRAAARRAW